MQKKAKSTKRKAAHNVVPKMNQDAIRLESLRLAMEMRTRSSDAKSLTDVAEVFAKYIRGPQSNPGPHQPKRLEGDFGEPVSFP